MRSVLLLLTAGALASCTMGPPATTMAPTPREQAELATLIGGKVAGPPVSCLSHYDARDMRTINEHTIAFRVNSSRVYLNGMQGGCPSLRPPYALVTRQFGSGQLCRGDIAQVVDTSTGITVGNCVFGDFIPYVRPRA